jgi:hypothetical protein
MDKHLIADATWVENRFRTRKRMTGRKLALDKESGFLVTSTVHGFTAEKKQVFLRRFEVCKNTKEICKSVGIHIQTFYDHLALDEAFRDKYNTFNEIEGKALHLNDAIVELEKAHKQEFVRDLLGKAKKYV